MTKNTSFVSVIIPAFNEEARLTDCLNSLRYQTVRPLEIIVVDNNSTDVTAAIARNFKGVRVLREKKQGRAYARNAGLNAAKGRILARIDADTIVPHDWVEQIQMLFDANPEADCVTGYGQNRVGVTAKWASDFCSWAYFTHSKAFFGVEMLWGSNMAVRKEIWIKAKNLCCKEDPSIHEDQDISLALASVGARVLVVPSLKVSVDFNDTQYFDKFLRYYQMQFTTKLADNAHRRSLLKTRRNIPLAKRLYYELISWYSIPVYFLFSIAMSAKRGTVNAFKSSSIYWWYQKIKRDFAA